VGAPAAAAPPRDRSRALEGVGDRARRGVLLLSRLVIDGRACDIAQPELAIAQRSPQGTELAGPHGGRYDGAKGLALALFDAFRQVDLALARK
jgi:hypothetical protein